MSTPTRTRTWSDLSIYDDRVIDATLLTPTGRRLTKVLVEADGSVLVYDSNTRLFTTVDYLGLSAIRRMRSLAARVIVAQRRS